MQNTHVQTDLNTMNQTISLPLPVPFTFIELVKWTDITVTGPHVWWSSSRCSWKWLSNV